MAMDAQERTEDATPKRKQEARRKGTVTKSVDLTSAIVLFALALVLPSAASRFGTGLMDSVRLGLGTVPKELSTASCSRFALAVLQPALGGLVPVVATAFAVGLLANFAQVGFVFSLESLSPTLEKLNPLTGFKRLVSARAGVEGIKASVKAVLFGYIAFSAIAGNWERLIGLSWMTPLAAVAQVGMMIHGIFLRVAVAWLCIAALDYFFQRKQTDKQLRMTREELKREFKEQETAPEIKAVQSQRRKKLAKGRMMDRVKTADVVITNPTHFAVAVKYERNKTMAPVVVAKGQDYLALKIREVAIANRIPIVPNPPLARSLYKQCEIGDFIPRDMFQAVAEVLAYVYKTVRGLK